MSNDPPPVIDYARPGRPSPARLPSRYGQMSCCTILLIFLLLGIMMIWIEDGSYPGNDGVVRLTAGTGLLIGIWGIGLAIRGLCEPHRSRVSPVIGLVLNLLISYWMVLGLIEP